MKANFPLKPSFKNGPCVKSCLSILVWGYTNNEKMKEHMEDCFKYGGQKIQLPQEGKNTIEFKDIHKQHIYADFECLLRKVQDDKNKNTKKISKHEISGYSYCITSPYFPTEYRSYRGRDAGQRFVKKIGYEGSRLNKLIKGANAQIMVSWS